MRILIVDDHPLVRKGIASTLSFEDDIEDIKEASTIREALRQMSDYKPEIAVVDLNLGKENGLTFVKQAKEIQHSMKFIILTSSSKKEDFLRAQEIGIDGYILKEAFTEDIIYAFKVIARGKKFFDSEILQHTINQPENDCLKELTPREKDVLIELGRGLSNIQIAGKLFISENTVKKHITNILGKLELRHRTEAALFINRTTTLANIS